MQYGKWSHSGKKQTNKKTHTELFCNNPSLCPCFSSNGKVIQDRSFYWPGFFWMIGKAAISDGQSQLGNTVLVASRGNQCCQQWLWSSQKVEQRISQESINQQLLSQHRQWYLVLKCSGKVPWDVINSHLTSHFQLRKNMLNIEGHGSEK